MVLNKLQGDQTGPDIDNNPPDLYLVELPLPAEGVQGQVRVPALDEQGLVDVARGRAQLPALGRVQQVIELLQAVNNYSAQAEQDSQAQGHAWDSI